MIVPYAGVVATSPGGRGPTLGVRWQGGGMGIAKKIAAVGIAKKVYDEARKPHNQAKIRSAVRKVQQRRSGGARP